MSNYECEAFHPVRKRMEKATAYDDYYGKHKYGIVFSDGSVFSEGACLEALGRWRMAVRKSLKRCEATVGK